MTNWEKHYSGNICNIVCPRTLDINKNWFVFSTLTYNFLSLKILSFWTNDVPKVTQFMSLQICHFRFSIFVLKTLIFKKRGWYSPWQCFQYLALNTTHEWGVTWHYVFLPCMRVPGVNEDELFKCPGDWCMRQNACKMNANTAVSKIILLN